MLRDWLLKKHFEHSSDLFEDDSRRQFKISKSGKELLEVQENMFLQTGSFLPDNY